MGGITNNKQSTFSINSKPTLFHIVIGLITIVLLTILAISIKLSFLRAASNEGASDTGAATLNSVSITKLGSTNSDGASLTVTYSDGSQLSANKDNNEILNNDEVIYEASYNVTAPGTITLSFTMPANNVINEASVSEASGCMAGSKVEKADITNSDGTITKSYTNNKATCIINPTTTGTTTWTISVNPWGGNNEEIQPTLSISGQEQPIKPEAVKTVGKGDYGLEVTNEAAQSASDGWDKTVYPALIIYANKNDSGVVGITPLTDGGEWSINIDTSGLPDGWKVAYTYTTAEGVGGSGGGAGAAVQSGRLSAERSDDGSLLKVSWLGGVTAVSECPSMTSQGVSLDSSKCYYLLASMWIWSPVESLTEDPRTYEIKYSAFDAQTMGGGLIKVNPSMVSQSWQMSSRGYGNPVVWGRGYHYNTGWEDYYNQMHPIYTGENVDLASWIQLNTVPSGNFATNLQYCATFNENDLRIAKPFSDRSDSIISGDYGVQYGAVTSPDSGWDDANTLMCGEYDDGRAGFADDLAGAYSSAISTGQTVNAMRLWSSKVNSGMRNGALGDFAVAPIRSSDSVIPLAVNASAITDQWNTRGIWVSASNSSSPTAFQMALTPGLLSHALTAIPSSTNPGKEDHITISTKTYNKDTNTKITTTLPSGLSPKAGSFTITTGYDSTGTPIKEVLIEGEGQDYTIASSSDGGYTITFDLDHIATTYHVPLTGYDPIYPGESGVTNIAWNSESSSWQEVITTNNNNEDDDLLNDDLPIAADNDGNGIDHAHTPIEFDLVVNEDAPVPSTLTINSTVTGTGTSYASTSFKTTSDTIAIANPPATFGYDLTATPSSIYAGDNLTYNYSISNTTKGPASDITMVSVLPYNGDSRGTTGLKEVEENNPYTLTNLSLSLLGDGTVSGLDTSTTRLYYTLDPKVRDLESTNPEALGADSSITWQELAVDSDGTIPLETMTKLEEEGTSIAALKLTTTTLPSGSKLNLEVTLDNILATTPGAQAKLASDITYLTYRTESNSINTQNTNTNSSTNSTPTILLSSDNYTVYSNGQTISTHQNPITTNYLGELLALSIPEDEQSISITTKPGTVLIGDPLINHLSLTTGTLHGYTLTMRSQTINGALTNKDQTRTIPTISTKPTAAQAGWSATIAGSNNPSLNSANQDNTYTAIPGINQTPLNLYTSTAKGRDNRNLTITYGLGTTHATAADIYTTEVVYTMTGE